MGRDERLQAAEDAARARDLADLTRVAGWSVLTDTLARAEQSLLTELSQAREDAEVLVLARRWQNFRRWTTLVRDEPTRLAEELGAELERKGSSMDLYDFARSRQTNLRPVQKTNTVEGDSL